MRKNIIYNIIGLFILVAGLIGCDQASQEASPIVEPNDSYPVATFTTDFTGNAVEEGDTIDYTVTINKPIKNSIVFSAQVIGGDASGSDIEVINGTISPYLLETTVSVVFTRDMLPEETESATIEIGAYSLASKYLLHPSTEYATLNVNIGNYASDILIIECAWDKEVVINSNEPYHEDYTYIEHASLIDFDMEVYDADFNLVAGAWTGDSPEVLEIDETTLANGTYTIMSFLWANDFSQWSVEYAPETVNHTDVPFTNTFYQQGVFTDVVSHQDPLQYTNTADSAYYDGINGEYIYIVDYRVVGQFTYEDGVVTVLEYDDTELGGAKVEDKILFDPKRYENKF